MSSLFESTYKSVPTTSTSHLPDYIQAAGRGAVNLAGSLATEPYTPYSGPRIAGLSDTERSGINLIKGSSGRWSPLFSEAANLTRKAATGDRDINPFIKGALDPVARAMRDEFNQARIGERARAVSTGAFGGTRRDLVDAELEGRFMENLGDMYARGYATAWDKAGDDMMTGAAQLGRIGGLGLQSDVANFGALMEAGGVERGVTQANLDRLYSDFLEQRDWPVRGLNLLISTLAGTPYERSTTSNQVVASPSVAGQIGGLGLSAAAAAKLLDIL